MKHELPVENRVIELISTLQNAGFEAYIVGGAIRDLLLGRRPKDYDISTAATPEEVRNVFGRRAARIIGKRFRLVHVRHGGELGGIGVQDQVMRTILDMQEMASNGYIERA